MYTKLFKDEKSCGRRVEEAQRQYATAQKSLQRFLQRAYYISFYFSLCLCFSNCRSYFYWPFDSYHFRNSNTRKCMGSVFTSLSHFIIYYSLKHLQSEKNVSFVKKKKGRWMLINFLPASWKRRRKRRGGGLKVAPRERSVVVVIILVLVLTGLAVLVLVIIVFFWCSMVWPFWFWWLRCFWWLRRDKDRGMEVIRRRRD